MWQEQQSPVGPPPPRTPTMMGEGATYWHCRIASQVVRRETWTFTGQPPGPLGTILPPQALDWS